MAGGDPPGAPAGPGLVLRCRAVRRGDRAWFRAVLEAYDGLATWWASPGEPRIWLLAPTSRAGELDGLLDALAAERPGAFLTVSSDPP